MKKIFGGSAPVEGPITQNCENDSDCGEKVRDCGNGYSFIARGGCVLKPGATQKTCTWAGCPSSPE